MEPFNHLIEGGIAGLEDAICEMKSEISNVPSRKKKVTLNISTDKCERAVTKILLTASANERGGLLDGNHADNRAFCDMAVRLRRTLYDKKFVKNGLFDLTRDELDRGLRVSVKYHALTDMLATILATERGFGDRTLLTRFELFIEAGLLLESLSAIDPELGVVGPGIEHYRRLRVGTGRAFYMGLAGHETAVEGIRRTVLRGLGESSELA